VTTDYQRQYARGLRRRYSMDDDAFKAKIAADPTDPAPRLVYADWLDEQSRHEEARVQRAASKVRVFADRFARESGVRGIDQTSLGRDYTPWVAVHQNGENPDETIVNAQFTTPREGQSRRRGANVDWHSHHVKRLNGAFPVERIHAEIAESQERLAKHRLDELHPPTE
jgi:uncharacterized protein (TIGR02996 family)